MSPLPLAVLISGGGTTLRNLLQLQVAGKLNARIALVISSSPTAKGLAFAAEFEVPALVIQRKNYASSAEFSAAHFAAIRQAGCQLVVMGGFLKHLPIAPDFENRVINIHPSLIPAFCGQGMFGHHVHEAVLAMGAKVSGCTVHFVDNQYDHGPIISQHPVPVLAGDTAEVLAARVFAAECAALPAAVELFAQGRLKVVGRQVVISDN